MYKQYNKSAKTGMYTWSYAYKINLETPVNLSNLKKTSVDFIFSTGYYPIPSALLCTKAP